MKAFRRHLLKKRHKRTDFSEKNITFAPRFFEKQTKTLRIMALAIANIPVLEGAEAEAFVREANENLKLRGTVEIGMSAAECRSILEKSRRAREAFYASKRV